MSAKTQITLFGLGPEEPLSNDPLSPGTMTAIVKSTPGKPPILQFVAVANSSDVDERSEYFTEVRARSFGNKRTTALVVLVSVASAPERIGENIYEAWINYDHSDSKAGREVVEAVAGNRHLEPLRHFARDGEAIITPPKDTAAVLKLCNVNGEHLKTIPLEIPKSVAEVADRALEGMLSKDPWERDVFDEIRKEYCRRFSSRDLWQTTQFRP